MKKNSPKPVFSSRPRHSQRQALSSTDSDEQTQDVPADRPDNGLELYLTSLRKVPTLGRQEEQNLFNELRDAEHARQQALYRSPWMALHLEHWIGLLQAGKLPITSLCIHDSQPEQTSAEGPNQQLLARMRDIVEKHNVAKRLQEQAGERSAHGTQKRKLESRRSRLLDEVATETFKLKLQSICVETVISKMGQLVDEARSLEQKTVEKPDALSPGLGSLEEAEALVQRLSLTLHDRFEERIGASLEELRACYAEVLLAEHRLKKTRNRLVAANGRLVASIAQDYQRPRDDLMDLIQAGNLGLLQAVNRYKPRSEGPFSSYATWWIRQAITKEIGTLEHSLRMSSSTQKQLRNYQKAEFKLAHTLGRPPERSEIADTLGVSLQNLERLLLIKDPPISLDTGGTGEEGAGRGDLYELLAAPGPQGEEQEVREQAEEIKQMLSTLSPQEARIIKLSYGFDDPGDLSLSELAQKLDITKQRAKRLKTRALRKLRQQHREQH